MKNNDWPDHYSDLPGQDDIMSNVMEELFPEKMLRRRMDICPVCDTRPTKDSFRDEISWREYLITGLCQEDQDKFYSAMEEMEEENPNE